MTDSNPLLSNSVDKNRLTIPGESDPHYSVLSKNMSASSDFGSMDNPKRR